MKKFLSLVLCVALLVSCVSLTAFADDEWLTLRVECFDRSIPGFNVQDCMQLRYIQENFGDPNHIKVEFVPFSRWEEGDLMNTQLAGGTAPDLCMTYNGAMVDQYIEMGGLYQLDELLKDAPNLVAFLGEELLTYGQQDADGDGTPEQYYVPARRVSVANVGNFIRADWLAALNMEKPTTIEEFEAYLRGAKEANLGGEQTIPFLLALYKPDPLINTIRFTDAFIDFSQVTEEDWFAYSSNHEMLPGSREGYRWLNKLYNEGLLWDSFAIDDGTMADRNRVQGYTGFFTEQPDQPWRTDKNLQIELEKNVPGASWTTVNCFANADGKRLHDVYAANGMSIFIPTWVSEKTAKAAIAYLDWMAQPENMFFLQNGMEGINYLSTTEDGIPTEIQGTDVVADEYKMHAVDVCFIANGQWYGDMERSNAAIALSFPGYEAEVEASYANAYTDTWTQISFTTPLQSIIDYETMVKSKQGEFMVKVLTCKPEEFDAAFDASIQNILDTGASEIIAEKRAAYQNGQYRGTFPYAE